MFVTAVRGYLIAAIVAAFWASRRGFDWSGYRIAALAVLVGLILFNFTAVATEAAEWDRNARATIIELFLTGLMLMTLPRDAFIGLAAGY